jgi:inhibitor of the pro-sigma K processing machinery
MSALPAWSYGAGAALFALLLLRRPLRKLAGLLLRSSAWLALLALLQQAGGILGVRLGVNLANALVLGLLGAPGFGLLLLLRWALQ